MLLECHVHRRKLLRIDFQVRLTAGIRGLAYNLEPGEGAHQVNAPIGGEWSGGFSFPSRYCLHGSTRNAKIYQANYFLRKFGMGISPEGDDAKERFLESFRSKPTSFNSVVHSGFHRITWPGRRLTTIRRIADRFVKRRIVR